MPPKAKYTKKEIVEAAFSLIREQGMDALSARSLAKRLGTSTAPIFTAFRTIDEIQTEVIKSAKALYTDYITEGLRYDPPFKGYGLQFIRFAEEEPELFQLLYMSEVDMADLHHFLPDTDENAPLVFDVLIHQYGLPEDEAGKLYNQMSIYVYGLAILLMRKVCCFTPEEISEMLTDAFNAFTKNKFTTKNLMGGETYVKN